MEILLTDGKRGRVEWQEPACHRRSSDDGPNSAILTVSAMATIHRTPFPGKLATRLPYAEVETQPDPYFRDRGGIGRTFSGFFPGLGDGRAGREADSSSTLLICDIAGVAATSPRDAS